MLFHLSCVAGVLLHNIQMCDHTHPTLLELLCQLGTKCRCHGGCNTSWWGVFVAGTIVRIFGELPLLMGCHFSWQVQCWAHLCVCNLCFPFWHSCAWCCVCFLCQLCGIHKTWWSCKGRWWELPVHLTLPTPYSTLHTPYSPFHTLHCGTPHSALYTPCSILCTLDSTLYVLHCTLLATLYTLRSTLHTLLCRGRIYKNVAIGFVAWMGSTISAWHSISFGMARETCLRLVRFEDPKVISIFLVSQNEASPKSSIYFPWGFPWVSHSKNHPLWASPIGWDTEKSCSGAETRRTAPGLGPSWAPTERPNSRTSDCDIRNMIM